MILRSIRRVVGEVIWMKIKKHIRGVRMHVGIFHFSLKTVA